MSSPFYNLTTGDLSVSVTSDLWSPVSGTANLTWYDWSGNELNISTPSSVPVNVGAINSSMVWDTNTFQVLNGTANANYSDIVLRASVSVEGSLPNTVGQTQTFTHENWFHASPLSSAGLVDPGLQLSYDNSTQAFTVKATTGVAAWVWLEYGSGAVVHFDSNAFWLAKGESREVGYSVQSDTTNGAWIEGVTVESLYNNTLST